MHQDDDDNVDFGNGIDHSMFEDDETEDDVEEAAEIETSTVEQLVPPSWIKHDTHSPSLIGEYSSKLYFIQIIQDIFPDILLSPFLQIQTKAYSKACSKTCSPMHASLLYNQAEQ